MNFFLKLLNLFMNIWGSTSIKTPIKKESIYSPLDMSPYQGIPAQKLPQIWQPFYVLYQYSWSKSEYLVGFSSLEQAEQFKNEMSKKKDNSKTELFHDYPSEILKRGLK